MEIKADLTLRVVMIISTVVLFTYGLFKGYDTLELFIYDIYFVTLILYLVETNFIKKP
jgi:hypothetical protein